MNIAKLKISVLILFISFAIKAKSEILQVKIYYNKNWTICKSDKAYYYRICLWYNEKHVFEGEFADYLLNETKIVQGKYEQGKKSGEFIFYYETGEEKIRASFITLLPLLA